MSEEIKVSPSDHAEPLHCPNCDYNLTGLTRNICPECGREFDPERIRNWQSREPKPIGKRELVRRIIEPMLFGLAGGLYVLGEPYLKFLIIPMVFFVPVVWLISALTCAERLAMNLVIRKGLPRPTWRRQWGTILLALGLVFAVEVIGTAIVGVVSMIAGGWLREQLFYWLSS